MDLVPISNSHGLEPICGHLTAIGQYKAANGSTIIPQHPHDPQRLATVGLLTFGKHHLVDRVGLEVELERPIVRCQRDESFARLG